jgi:hypothetical protein
MLTIWPLPLGRAPPGVPRRHSCLGCAQLAHRIATKTSDFCAPAFSMTYDVFSRVAPHATGIHKRWPRDPSGAASCVTATIARV